jgi:hypothetical protein
VETPKAGCPELMYMKTMLDILDERGWSHEEKAGLLWFIEGIMHINDDHLWEEWEHELDHRKEETSMYISLMERKGVEKGVKKGVKIGEEKGGVRPRTGSLVIKGPGI